MLKAMQCSSKKIAIFIVAALLINNSPLTYSQTLWQQTQAGLAKGLKALASKLPELVQSAASKINASVKEKLKQIKDVAPTIIIPKLLENLERLGQKVGSISSCMINGTCSNQERAAFIATAVTILALTAALIGFTITLAATSKEVDEQVIKVSEEVKGWNPKAIFTRLENAMAQFKQSLTSMQTCLLKRQCTKTQKKVLYATAGTIAALATIAVGVGIGSYVYAQHQEKQQAQEAEKPAEEGPVLEQMGAYDETEPSWKTKFMQQVSSIIKPVKGITTTLKSAYESIQQQIKSGAIKTKQKAAELFNDLVLKAKSLDDIIKETLDVSIATALNQFDVVNNKFTKFKNSLPQLWSQQMQALRQQLENIANYAKTTAQNLEDAHDAMKNLGIKDLIVAKWKSDENLQQKRNSILNKKSTLENKKNLFEQELAQKRQQLQQEIDKFYAEQAQAEPTTEPVPQPKKSILTTIKKKLSKKKPEDVKTIAAQMQEFEQKNQLLAKEEAEKNEAFSKAAQKIQKKLETIDMQILFEQIVNKGYLNQIYPTLVTMLNALDFKYLDELVTTILVEQIIEVLATPSTLPASGKIGLAIAIGFTAAHENILDGIKHIIDGVQRFGEYTKKALTIQPIITAPEMSTTEVVKALTKTGTKVAFVKKAAGKIPHILNMRQPILQTVEQIEKSIENLENAIKHFRSKVTQQFVDTIKESPLKNIPKAPIILFRALAEGIRTLKIAFNDTLQHSADLLHLALQVVPDIYTVAEDFNNFFMDVTGSTFVNPEFLETVKTMLLYTMPDINEGLKKLLQHLAIDKPTLETIATGATD